MGELGNLAHQLHPGGPSADDDERQPFGTLLRIGGQLRHLELGQDGVALQAGILNRLHSRRVLSELGLAEVGVGGPGCDDQRVVGQLETAAVGLAGSHDPRIEVDVVHVGEDDARVALFGQNAAQRRCDQAGREDAGGDLIEQRLEQVMVGSVNHREIQIDAVESPRDVETAEPAADDDHPVALADPIRYRMHRLLRYCNDRVCPLTDPLMEQSGRPAA